MLTSLMKLCIDSLDGLVGPSSGCEADVEWQHRVVQELRVGGESLGGPSGKELTELLTHLPSLSDLEICKCKNITQLAVGLDVQQTRSAATSEVEQEKEEEEDGMLLFPTHLSDSLRTLKFWDCPELVLVDPLSAFLPAQGGGGGFQALQSLQNLQISGCPKIFSAKSLFSSLSCCLFPSSLQQLYLDNAKGLGTLEPLSNLTSLTLLQLLHCGEDLRCKGLEPLLTAGGQLRELYVRGSPGFFAGWDPNPTQVLLQDGGEEQELQQLVSPLSSSKLQSLDTDDAMGLLAVPICSLLSSSLTRLGLHGTYYREMERFTKEQEDALPLLASLQELNFWEFNKLQSLPATLHKLTNLKRLLVLECPAVRSLPKDGLPKSLQQLDVNLCENEELSMDDAMGLLAMPICSLLSSSLTHLTLHGTYYREMEQFTKEQEDALPLLASLQELSFMHFNKLQSLPATLHKLTNLKWLLVCECPAVRSLPKDGLPKSLQVLNVYFCENEELIQQCKGLVGTIPEIIVP